MRESLGPHGSLRKAGTDLVLTSFIVLFQEMTLIRWVSGEVRVLAYFPNVVLISAFLGLGIGALLAGRRSYLWLWPIAVALVVAATHVMSRIAFTNQSPTEHLWLLYWDIPQAPVIGDVRPPIVIVFILSALSFVPLGQIIGDRLREFAGAKATLWGYVADLSGSLLGVIAFAAASFFRTFPIIWFATFLLAGLWLFARRGARHALVYATLAVAVVASVGLRERGEYYSPYYALRTVNSRGSAGVEVLANGSLHQYAAPLAATDRVTSAYDKSVRAGYPKPYEVLGRKPRHVLVLGAGTGNDVATALDRGAERVDAVEIDPVIIELGRTKHPNRPYNSPRVRVFNTDARAYLRNTSERYDLIVFGTLDSLTRLSALSNVRLDNYVYTVECIRAARDRLTPDGGVALYFMVGEDAIDRKLFAMLTQAFGIPPLVRREGHKVFNTIYAAGPAWNHMRDSLSKDEIASAQAAAAATDVPSDDWPYLYLHRRAPSAFYVSVLLILLSLSIAGIALAAPELVRSGKRIDFEMFLFGAAFLLLETKLVTQMSLVWGTTWVTSAVVFSAILLMILIGTIAMQLRPFGYPLAFGGLVVSLLATWVIPVEAILTREPSLKLLLSIVYAGLPILFASICFAIRFKSRDASNAFGWNLAGAVFGGLLEFMSMSVGTRAMTLVALAAYLLALLLQRRAAQP